MNADDPFLDPRCRPKRLASFVVRSGILRALREVAPLLRGTVLDVGCGSMPYKPLVLSTPSQAARYIGLDLARANYAIQPDLTWDGKRIPLDDASVDCVLATEVFEHCPEPEIVMREINRVLNPKGFLFLTVPFLWPLHETPYDEYRYTPFALERHLRNAGFPEVKLHALGGFDASLAQMIGIWTRMRPLGPLKRQFLSILATPLVCFLVRRDRPPETFGAGVMITGLWGKVHKAGA